MKQFILSVLLITYYTGSAQQVPDFTLVNAMNDKNVSLSDYTNYAGVLIIFTSNACPYDGYYLNRIKKFSQDYKSKIPVLLVNSNTNESPEAMRKYGDQCGFTTPYLADKEQTLMQSLGATKSPEAFLLKNSGRKFSIEYRGAIDDNPQVESDVHDALLKNAVEAMLAGKAIQTKEARPVGCTLRKK